MNPLSLRDLKFFKAKGSSVSKAKASAGFKKGKEIKPFLYLAAFVIVIAYSLSYLPLASLPEPEEGEIVAADIVAPETLTVEDKETTEKRRKEAVDAVLPVYNLDQNVFLNTEEKIREFFNAGRELVKKSPAANVLDEFKKTVLEAYGFEISSTDLRSLSRAKFSASLEENLINLISKALSQGVILKNLLIHGEQEKGITLIRDQGAERAVKISELLDLRESKVRLAAEVDQLGLARSENALLKSLSQHFISPNITYNNLLTEARKEQARSRVETVFYTIKKGKIIIRKGDEATKDIINQIRIIDQNLRAKPGWLTNFIGTFLLFALFFVILWYYLKSILRPRDDLRNFLMMGVTLILSLFLYKLSIFLAGTFSQTTSLPFLKYGETYNYAFPFQAGALLFAFLTRIHLALVFTVINSLLVGSLLKTNFYLMIFTLIGGFAAIYGIKYYGKQHRTTTFRAGLFLVAPVNTFVIIAFHLIREKLGPFDYFASELIMGVIGGAISASLAFLFLPFYEYLFGIVTQTKLLELSNSDLPIFRKMAIEAPGSYHHSLIVSSLSENAAEEIKLDPMLVKAGALYHDIGKIKRPEYFIENRPKNFDIHKDLKPSMSALVIVNHVKEGVETAKKLKLPRLIREIIEQHHGDNLVRYFYEKAKEEYDPEMQKIGEESYRYPGPQPQSKEAALVMLADSVEAASRSLKSPSKTSLKKVISDIFNNFIQDGQLDDCDFSLKELRSIAASFLSTLYTIYHHRVEYPGFDFEMKKIKKQRKSKPVNDRDFKQAT